MNTLVVIDTPVTCHGVIGTLTTAEIEMKTLVVIDTPVTCPGVVGTQTTAEIEHEYTCCHRYTSHMFKKCWYTDYSCIRT